MRLDCFVNVISIDPALEFYVNELGFFNIKYDFGMGNVLISHNENSDICLRLKEHNLQPSPDIVFALEVKNCKDQFEIFKSFKFKSGGQLSSNNLLEYPVESSFIIKDPSGNKILIFEPNY
ncbi:hypothetical protein RCC89_03855 [Cytophagaceae bacterium ABcell3]|nr:hypothetical protein RCC89_03855 [Cytophagaceae bacterium ABcell3]